MGWPESLGLMFLNDRTFRTEIGKKSSDSLRAIVDYGAALLEMIQRTTPASPFKVVTCLLFREAMQKVEVMATLFETSQSDGGEALLRPLIEVFIYLRFLMQQPKIIGHRELKAWAILYSAKQKRLAELRIHLAGTPLYREAKAVARQELSAAIYLLNEPSVEKQIKSLERELELTHFSQFTPAWEAYKAANGSAPPWYVLVGEKPGLDALARKVRLGMLYKHGYRHFRDHVHGVASLTGIEYEIGLATEPEILPIRSGRYSPLTYGTVLGKALELCKAMTVAHFDSAELFNKWFRAERKSGRLLTKGFMTEPKDDQPE